MTLKIHISSHNDDLHNTTAKRNLSGGVAGIDTDNYFSNNHIPLHSLTVSDFQVNVGTGTANAPEELNDGDDGVISGDMTAFDTIGEYVEVLFDHPSLITEYRFYFNSSSTHIYKIQYLYEGNWIDNTINISVPGSGWSAWTNLTVPVYTQGIRLIVTYLTGINFISEMELKG